MTSMDVGQNKGRFVRARVLGYLNLIFAGLGLLALLINTVGYHGLPASFIQEEAPFMSRAFPPMAIATLVLLTSLGYSGILLLKRSRPAFALCALVFFLEIVCLGWFLSKWQFPFSPISPVAIAPGLMNLGLALQIVTAYPIIGLVLLIYARRLP
jgi:hypothetical protein